MPGSASSGIAAFADGLVATRAERRALDAVREASGETGGPMEGHAVRCFVICEELARRGGHAVDREALLVACLLHDLGLYDRAKRGAASYVTDGRVFAGELLAREGWEHDRLRRCLDAIEHHHELRAQWDLGAEAELLRRADQVELSAGLRAWGLPRGWLRGLFRRVPRRRVYREIASKVLANTVQNPRRVVLALNP